MSDYRDGIAVLGELAAGFLFLASLIVFMALLYLLSPGP